MSLRYVPIPMAVKPMANLSKFLFRIGRGEWMYKLLGTLTSTMAGADVFGKYTPTAKDVIVATHSRSGTNWMIQIALQIAHHGNAEYDYVYDLVAWPEFFDGAAIDINDPPPPSPIGLRVVKTHSIAESAYVSDVAKYVIAIRDPKEVVVSLYHFAPQAFAYMGWQVGTPEYFIEKFLKNQVPASWWVSHTAGWWALRDKPNVHIITFNDLKADTGGEIDRLSAYLEVTLDTEARQRVIEKASFAHMKANNHKFSPDLGGTGAIDIVRKGKTGATDDHFTPELLARVDAHCKRELAQLGSDFPYDEFFG